MSKLLSVEFGSILLYAVTLASSKQSKSRTDKKFGIKDSKKQTEIVWKHLNE